MMLNLNHFHFEDILMGWPLLQQGLLVTLGMSLIAITLSLILGTILGVVRHEDSFLLRRISALYIEFIRSIPLILFMAFVHYGVMFSVNNWFGRDSSFLESAIVAMVLFESAYIAEIIRGGFRSISVLERDTAKSLGLSYPQQLVYIYLPLAYARSAPALIGQFIALIKDTSLASIIGVMELTRQGEIIYQNTFHDFEILLVTAFIYFVICFSLSQFSRRFEFGSNQRNMTLALTES